MNILKLLAGIEATLRRVKTWDGWTDQDRVLIEDTRRQIDDFHRRAVARTALMRRGGR